MLLSHGRGGLTDHEKPNDLGSQLSIMNRVLSDPPSHVVGQSCSWTDPASFYCKMEAVQEKLSISRHREHKQVM